MDILFKINDVEHKSFFMRQNLTATVSCDVINTILKKQIGNRFSTYLSFSFFLRNSGLLDHMPQSFA